MKAAATYPGALHSCPGHCGLLGTLPGKPARSWGIIGVRPTQVPETAVGTGCWFQPHHCGLAHEVTLQSLPLPPSGRWAAQDSSGAGAPSGQMKPLIPTPGGCPGFNLTIRVTVRSWFIRSPRAQCYPRGAPPHPVVGFLPTSHTVCKHPVEPHTPHQVRAPGASESYLARSRCFWTRVA